MSAILTLSNELKKLRDLQRIAREQYEAVEYAADEVEELLEYCVQYEDEEAAAWGLKEMQAVMPRHVRERMEVN